MSAWVVSNRHIDYLVSAALKYGERWLRYDGQEVTYASATEVGSNLLLENIASVCYRYKDDEPNEYLEGGYTFTPHMVDAIQTLKAIACYEYQSCEHPEWETSAAKKFCADLTGATIHKLPGYDAAKWGIDS